ncbi:MAG TPA: BON domain-containing protein [Pyrinomonadaceae bacterium]|nr:BON domain-containing protein [Pyrinomonadaceae bacterium]
MSSRYGGRGYGRYGDPEDDRTDERLYERDSERGYRTQGGRHERGSEYGGLRRGGYAGGRAREEREYGQERDYGSRDVSSRDYGPRYGAREYGGGEYGSRYGREVFERGGYSPAPRRHEGEEYGRPPVLRPPARDYERRVERAYRHDDDADEVREYDTDYGRTTSRFYGRSGYEYGRDDYDEDDRDDRRRHDVRGREDEHRGEGGSWLDRAADQVRSWLGSGDDDRERGRHGDESRRALGRGEGKFRGLGPKNYRRSDDRLREEVCDRLTDNEWLDASGVEVNVVAGEVILTGMVDSRYAKRLAENIADSVSGVSNVQNNLRVQSYEPVASEAPLAGMDTALPAPNTTTPASDIAATSSTSGTTDVDDLGSPSSRAAGQS